MWRSPLTWMFENKDIYQKIVKKFVQQKNRGYAL